MDSTETSFALVEQGRKRCARCKLDLPNTVEFWNSHHWCKSCSRKYFREQHRRTYVVRHPVRKECACGRMFVGGGNQRFCSPDCAKDARKQKRAKEISCISCGKMVLRYGKSLSGFCGACSAHRAAKIKSELYAIRSGFRTKAKKPKNIYVPNLRVSRATTNCEECHAEIIYLSTRKKIPRYCSRKCVGAAIKIKNKPTKARHCRVCGTEYSPLPALYRTVTCSIECRDLYAKEANNASKRKRRVALRASGMALDLVTQYVNAIAVFARDGWKCRACGCDTPRRLRGTHDDNAPEVDHVVPVAHGGSHCMDNLQCLCRACNALKGTMSMELFMRWSSSDDVPHFWDKRPRWGRVESSGSHNR